MSAIYELLKTGVDDPVYAEKMMHRIPVVAVVRREKYLLEACRGKVVLDIGASGPMSVAIGKVAKEYHSINIQEAEYCIDLDKAEALPEMPDVELIIAGEVIEHLSNAGHFLDLLKVDRCPVILTTPNAMNETSLHYARRGVEMVNGEHVAYYSYHTLKTLVERHGWRVEEWHWYNGKPGTAEGLIFKLRGQDA